MRPSVVTQIIDVYLVLFSHRDQAWKLADFGLTSEGGSEEFVTTELARGTPGYRAPELLMDGRYVFNKKVDVWAMGIILYELAVGTKPFHSDAAVLEHFRSGTSLETPCDTLSEQGKLRILNHVREMVHNTPSSRPTVALLVETFSRYLAEQLIGPVTQRNESF